MTRLSVNICPLCPAFRSSSPLLVWFISHTCPPYLSISRPHLYTVFGLSVNLTCSLYQRSQSSSHILCVRGISHPLFFSVSGLSASPVICVYISVSLTWLGLDYLSSSSLLCVYQLEYIFRKFHDEQRIFDNQIIQ